MKTLSGTALWCLLGTLLLTFAPGNPVQAEVLDRIVAYIDSEAVTLSELEESYAGTLKIRPSATRLEVLEVMINRHLLLIDARRLRLEAEDDTALLKEYVDLKVKAFIKVGEQDMRKFYDDNKAEFVDLEFDNVKERISEYLLEKEVNRKLSETIERLKSETHIKIMLEPADLGKNPPPAQ
jgi:hypothetical protein